ncbi:MAG: alkaline phosphatase family protein [Candidatus Nanohaloarchaea archaeon]|nr:alkaline phosphatase family protein [Candidatus Nanohaloarchaea archaeon]
MAKTVVLGMDGLSPYIVDELIEEGKMPNMEELIEKGVYGELRSTIPPATVPAWPAMFSGLNPGKFGVFNFMNPLTKHKKGNNLEVIDSTYWEGEMFWDLMTEQGKRTGVIEVPATHPPREIDGFMVTAFLGPEKETYPEELEEEIERNIEDFEIKDSDKFLRTVSMKKQAEDLMRARFSLTQYLTEEKDWDTYIFLINLTDWALHRANNREEVLEVYQKVDSEMEDLIDRVEENDWNLLIVSDHGGHKAEKRFYLNSWLREEGFLHTEKESGDAEKNLVLRMGEFLKKLGVPRDLLKTLNRVRRKITGTKVVEGKKGIMEKLDWDKTQAFAYMTGNNFIGIWINSRDKFSMGSVEDEEKEEVIEDIIGELEKIEEKYGEDIIEEVYRREEVFRGEHVEELPEIIVRTKDNVSMISELHPLIFSDTDSFIHHLNGTILGFGPDFGEGKKIEGAELIDIGPTLLTINNCWIPERADGRVLEDMFEAGRAKIEYRDESGLDV